MNNCVIHDQPFSHFCQNCADIICEQCLKNSHSDKLHNIQSLQSAYQKRITSIQTYLDTQIKTKRNNLLQQISKTNHKIQQIQKTATIIENDVQVQIEGLLIRLDNSQASKVIKFQSQIKRLQHLVNVVDDIFYTFQESVKVPQKFLLLYKQIKQRIVNVDVYQIVSSLTGDHTDLPEEFKSMKIQIQSTDQLQRECEFINDVLRKVLNTYQSVLDQKQLSVRQKQSQIIQEYFSMNERLIAHNFSLSKSCYFCGQYLSLTTVNTGCSFNRPSKMGEARSMTFIQAPNQFKGTRRHHWVATNKQLKQHKQILTNKLHLILIIIRKYLYQKSITINDLFKSDDKAKSGSVSQLVFSYILSNKLNLQEDQINILIRNFQGPNGSVNYHKLNELIKDKQYLDEPVSAISKEKVQETPPQKTKKYAY